MTIGKLSPYIFLGILLIILVFIGGVKYGSRVEKTNKKVAFMLTMTPSKAPTPTPVKPLEFNQIANKGCALQFLLPSTMTQKASASTSASFVDTQTQKTVLKFSCEPKNDIAQALVNPQIESTSIIFQNQKLEASEKKENSQDLLYFSLKSPLSGKLVYFLVDKRFLPLLNSSLNLGVKSTSK